MAESRLISISWRLFPLVSITFFCTKITATTQKKPKIAFRSTEPSCSSILRNSSPTKKFITCCCAKLIIVSTLNPFPKKEVLTKAIPSEQQDKQPMLLPEDDQGISQTGEYLEQDQLQLQTTTQTCIFSSFEFYQNTHPSFHYHIVDMLQKNLQ